MVFKDRPSSFYDSGWSDAHYIAQADLKRWRVPPHPTSLCVPIRCSPVGSASLHHDKLPEEKKMEDWFLLAHDFRDFGAWFLICLGQ